jgi:polysaccharide pyruvyl transferase WcaK-like protein
MHRWPDAVDHPVQVDFLRRIFAAFPDREIVFAIHEEFDVSLVQALGLNAGQVLYTHDPDDYVSLYTDPENVVLAMRLHAGMVAVANGVPAVFVGHDTRTYSFCQMLGLDWVELFEEAAADQAIAGLRAIFDGETALPATTADAYRRLRDSMERFMDANELPALVRAARVESTR